jgi:hypothetical protein
VRVFALAVGAWQRHRAIDLNPETNALGTAGDMSPRVVQVFRHFGFAWGGDFRRRPDPMHFQYATGH